MPGHESADPRPEAAYDDEPEARLAQPAADLEAALAGLDRAATTFKRRLGNARETAAPSQPSSPPPFAGIGESPSDGEPEPELEGAISDASEAAVDARMQEARREAREYLDGAKERADRLVRSMVAAVERESAEILAEVEQDVEARRRQAEADAARQLESGREAVEDLLAAERERIAALGEGIAGRAQSLTAGMEEAEEVRAQFETFVKALSTAADGIARDESASASLAELRAKRRAGRSSGLAA